jgi:hypothetical protein
MQNEAESGDATTAAFDHIVGVRACPRGNPGRGAGPGARRGAAGEPRCRNRRRVSKIEKRPRFANAHPKQEDLRFHTSG